MRSGLETRKEKWREIFTKHEYEIDDPWPKANVSQHKLEFKTAPNTDHRSKTHPPMSISIVFGWYGGIAVLCTESKPTRLLGVSDDYSRSARQLQ